MSAAQTPGAHGPPAAQVNVVLSCGAPVVDVGPTMVGRGGAGRFRRLHTDDSPRPSAPQTPVQRSPGLGTGMGAGGDGLAPLVTRTCVAQCAHRARHAPTHDEAVEAWTARHHGAHAQPLLPWLQTTGAHACDGACCVLVGAGVSSSPPAMAVCQVWGTAAPQHEQATRRHRCHRRRHHQVHPLAPPLAPRLVAAFGCG